MIKNTDLLAQDLKSTTHSTTIGVLGIGIIQGIAAGTGYWLFGINDPFFWAVITGFVSIIPLVGTTLIWAQVGLFLIAQGHTWPGIGLLLYGIVVISSIDNIARLLIQKNSQCTYSDHRFWRHHWTWYFWIAWLGVWPPDACLPCYFHQNVHEGAYRSPLARLL